MPYRTRKAPDAPRYESFWLTQFPFYWLPIVSLVLAAFGVFLLTLERVVSVQCTRANGTPTCRLTETDYRGRTVRSFTLVTMAGSRPRALAPNDDGEQPLQVFTTDGPSYSTLVEVRRGRAPELAAGIESFAEGRVESYAFEQANKVTYLAWGVFALIVLVWLGFPRGTELYLELPSGMLTVRARYLFFATTRAEFELLALQKLSADSISESILERLSASYLDAEVTLGSGPPDKVRGAIRFLQSQQEELTESRRRDGGG